MLEQLKSIISPLAPALGAMLGGPAGASVGIMLKKVLCDDEGASDEDLLTALGSPEAIIKLKELESQLFQATLQDKANAREMQIQTRSRVPEVLTYLLLALLAYIISLIALCDINPSESKVMEMLIGIIASAFVGACSFWFGATFHKGKKS
jgi:hypothetical protein